MNQKILVGAPVFDGKRYSTADFISGLKALDYDNFDIVFADNSATEDFANELRKEVSVIRTKRHELAAETVIEARNALRKKVLEEGYDYLFSFDQDVIPPKDAIKKLLSHNLPLISGLYLNYFKDSFGKVQAYPLVFVDVTDEEFDRLKNDPKYENTEMRAKIASGKITSPSQLNAQLTLKEVLSKPLIKARFTGLGCTLIHRSVLEKVEFAAAKDETDDATFFKAAKKAGFDLYVDTKVRCKHIVKPGFWEEHKWQ